MNTKTQIFHIVLSHAIWYLLCDSLYKSLKGQLQELIILFFYFFCISEKEGYGTYSRLCAVLLGKCVYCVTLLTWLAASTSFAALL